jgi:hypothetical protein
VDAGLKHAGMTILRHPGVDAGQDHPGVDAGLKHAGMTIKRHPGV